MSMAHHEALPGVGDNVVAGSEEVFEYSCEPCSAEKQVEATGYCQQCSEYLCDNCSSCHGKLSATKHHTVLDKSAMPKSKASDKIECSDGLTETCRKHPDKVLEFFCKGHNQVCCNICLTLDHMSCHEKSYIPDVSESLANSRDYTNLTADIERLVRKITKRQKKIDDDSENNDTFRAKALTDIDGFRDHVKELLAGIEKDTKRKVSILHQENTDLLNIASEQCQSSLSDLKSMTAYLEKISKAGHKNKMFVQLKMSSDRLAEVETRVNDNDSCKISRYAFNKEDNIRQIESALSAIRSVSLKQDGTSSTARYVREVNMKMDGDKEECNINGIAVLTKERMVVTDYQKQAVTLVDMKMNKLISRLPVSSVPCDITKMKRNKVAVSLGNEKKIEIISVSDVLSRSQTIETPGAKVVGLCYNGSNFITACQNPASIKIIDMSGRTLSTFATDGNRKRRFTLPRCVALGHDKITVYVTDMDANRVVKMDLSGSIISVYTHKLLKDPRGVVVGRDGIVYVCSKDTHTVHLLTPTGDHSRIILEPDHGLAHFPNAISYGKDDNRLYISSASTATEKCNFIRLYQLE